MIHTQLYKINVISICKTFPNQISHHTAIKREEFMFPMIIAIKKEMDRSKDFPTFLKSGPGAC